MLSDPPSPKPSRWILEMFAPDIPAWYTAFNQLEMKPLGALDETLVHSFHDYLRRKGYLTERQVEVLEGIAKKHNVPLPPIPPITHHSDSSLSELIHSLNPELPMSWNSVGGFFDGEATFRSAYEDMRLHTFITVPQKERLILEKIKDFIKDELNMDVSIYWDSDRELWRLMVFRFEDVYKLAHKVYPHLHHPKKRRDALNLMTTIIKHAETMIPIEKKRHRIKTAERYEQILKLAEQLPIHIYA